MKPYGFDHKRPPCQCCNPPRGFGRCKATEQAKREIRDSDLFGVEQAQMFAQDRWEVWRLFGPDYGGEHIEHAGPLTFRISEAA